MMLLEQGSTIILSGTPPATLHFPESQKLSASADGQRLHLETARKGQSAGSPATAAAAAAQPRRRACPSCGRSRAVYCEDCLVVLEQPAPDPIRLPCKFDIVQHGETNARSTALHAVLLAPTDTALHRHTNPTSRRCDALHLQRVQAIHPLGGCLHRPTVALPAYDPATTVVLFPEGPHTDVVGQCAPFERVVVLESNWKKAWGLLRHPQLAGLRRVQLPAGLHSDFIWRRGDCSFRGAVDEGLSSIEAIYHCCRLLGRGPPEQEQSYEGLLRYFRRTRDLVSLRVSQQGPLPTSRQEARQRQREAAAAAAAAAARPGRQHGGQQQQQRAPGDQAQDQQQQQGGERGPRGAQQGRDDAAAAAVVEGGWSSASGAAPAGG